MATSFQKEFKPGQIIPALTWNDMDVSWTDVTGTWDNPQYAGATSYSKESKPTTLFTKESKPTTSYSKESKP